MALFFIFAADLRN